MNEPSPTEVRRLPDTRSLRLTWSDGTVTQSRYDFLRGWCPCAGCQGHGALRLRFHPPAEPVTPEAIQPVGHYALSIVWSDGHGTGIYRYDLLRRLADLEEDTEVLDDP